jgi:hypothetical protein
VCRDEDSTVLALDSRWYCIWLSQEGRCQWHSMSVSGSAFLQSRANAMTNRKASVSVCERLQVGSWVQTSVCMPVL